VLKVGEREPEIDDEICAYPVMTIHKSRKESKLNCLLKERQIFIYKKQGSGIIKKGDQPVVRAGWRDQYTLP